MTEDKLSSTLEQYRIARFTLANDSMDQMVMKATIVEVASEWVCLDLCVDQLTEVKLNALTFNATSQKCQCLLIINFCDKFLGSRTANPLVETSNGSVLVLMSLTFTLPDSCYGE